MILLIINFDSAKENSYDSLLALNNMTKVAIAVIGTEDAFDKMFPNLRTARRLGSLISGNMYCNNYDYFSFIVKNLMKYQWFDKRIIPNEEIISALYEDTKGIIDQLIGLYIYIHIDYLRAHKRPEINASFIHKVSMKHYPNIQEVLAHMRDPVAENKRAKMAGQAYSDLEIIVNEELQKEAMNKASKIIEGKSFVDIDFMKKNIIKNVQMVTDRYNDETIGNMVNKVLNVKGNTNLSEKELTRKVMSRLEKTKSDKRQNGKAQNKSKSIKQMINYLENDK